MPRPKTPKKMNGDATINSVETPSTTPTTVAAETVTDPKKTFRKPTLVKTEVRATIVPINVEDEVRQLAYLLSERRGFEPGHETEDWLAAEREVRQRYHQHSA